MSDLKHLVDRYYCLEDELNIYFEEHIRPGVDACTTKEELQASRARISAEVVGPNNEWNFTALT